MSLSRGKKNWKFLSRDHIVWWWCRFIFTHKQHPVSLYHRIKRCFKRLDNPLFITKCIIPTIYFCIWDVNATRGQILVPKTKFSNPLLKTPQAHNFLRSTYFTFGHKINFMSLKTCILCSFCVYLLTFKVHMVKG